MIGLKEVSPKFTFWSNLEGYHFIVGLGGGGMYHGTFLLVGFFRFFKNVYVKSIEPTWEIGNTFVFFEELS